ncbi:MAG: glycoside hydrolase family 3 C-terminal domain-containing protein [Gemmatimonadota bacterium]|nr:glycoside hydrolase family 3 C-terminal domain-containing protein [Gemmatimonadota bacterium]
MDIERRVESLLARLTLDEKIGLLGGVNGFDVPGLPRLGIPQLGTADSPFGVRADGPSTVYAGGIGLAATWNPALAEQVGMQLGRDARARGKHYSLGPGVNIYRSPLNGRNFEYYGEDPFLGARIAVGFIRGVQSQGVSATIKHYVGNNSEFWRNTSDSRIDERTLREIYLPIFEAAVKDASVGAIMSAYNLTNGEYMTANRRLNVDVAKADWGFPGVMMSDWGATHDALGAANGGTDLEMPSPQHFNRDVLLPLVREGKVSQATIDDKVRRLLRNHVRFGWLDRPQLDPTIPRLNQAGREVALQAAREGIALLKNERDMLPLDAQRVRTIAVIGPNAHPAVPVGGGSAIIPPWHAVSFLEGLSNHLGMRATVLYARGIPGLGRVASTTSFSTAATGGRPGLNVEVFDNQELSGAPTSTRVDQRVMLGRPLDLAALVTSDVVDFSIFATPSRPLATRWTGYFTPGAPGSYDFFVQQGGFADAGYRLYVGDKLVADSWKLTKAIVETTTLRLDARPHKVVLEYRTTTNFSSPFVRMGVMRREGWVDPSAVALASRADVVVLAVGFDASTESEGWDRTFRLPPGQEELIDRVTAANRNTIVVITSGGGVDMTEWVDRVPAVLQAWYPGELGGVALAEILLGDVNPSGHLPATFERKWEENPAFASYYPTLATNRIEYREGVFVGYRGFERNGTKPLFPFGHGVSYTTFRYANLSVRDASGSTAASPRYDVTFDVTNAGSRAGAAVAQVYVGDRQASVPRPPKELKGFAKVTLRPGETRRVTVPLDLRSFAYYDVDARQWRAEAGEFDVLVGNSSADIVLRGAVTLARTATAR